MVPGGLRLHDYANLYFNARNKMMWKLKYLCPDSSLSVLSVSTNVLGIDGTVVSDQNASSGHARFAQALVGLERLDRDVLFARSWKHPGDQIAEWRHGSMICAEILVPHRVRPEFVTGAYVSCEEALTELEALAPGFPVTVNPDLFFRSPPTRE